MNGILGFQQTGVICVAFNHLIKSSRRCEVDIAVAGEKTYSRNVKTTVLKINRARRLGC
jgi:hypothetical protein